MRRKILFLALLLFFLLPFQARAASLSVTPASGTFTVGSTFTVAVVVDTDGKPINTFEIFLRFPADRLQIVSPATGESIASVWVGQPRFDNRNGTIELRGGIPGGITTGRGVIANIQFRAKSVGDVFVRIGENSRVLANDGSATDILQDTNGAAYRIVLPPPAGPLVTSPTHPDQDRWYTEQQVTFSWGDEPNASGYSYVLSQNPIDAPDNISEGPRTNVAYAEVASGEWYFHIKALRDGIWGGVTHFAAHIDREPPAEFQVEIISGMWTTQTQPVVQFFSTDALSGLDHFEIKIVPLDGELDPNSLLFVEATSPHISPPLDVGTYDIIVRAYDKSGNYRVGTERLHIVGGLSRFLNDNGVVLGRSSVLPWTWLLAGILLVLVLVILILYWARRRHNKMHSVKPEEMLSPDVKAQLQELQMYRQKYAKTLLVFLAILASLWMGQAATAAEPLAPPLIISFSENISNQEIFYVGGQTVPEAQVILHLQSTETGEVFSTEVSSDRKGDWFYRHSGFLRTGEYILWAQVAADEEVSPPSPQVRINVETAAFEFGSSRLSFALIYFTATVFLVICVIVLLFVLYRYVMGIRRKRQRLLTDLRMIEEKIRRGFAVLRKDVEAELALLNRADGRELLPEEKFRAEELQRDIEKISERIGEEVWELEKDAAA